jgi:hypothetical protein
VKESERRKSVRHNDESLIEYFGLMEEQSSMGQICNWSNEGICFNTRRMLIPGETICIRVKQYSHLYKGGTSKEMLRSITVAQVKWSMEKSILDENTNMIGAKILLY